MTNMVSLHDAIDRGFVDITVEAEERELRFAIDQLERSNKNYAILPMGPPPNAKIKILARYLGKEGKLSTAANDAIAAFKAGYISCRKKPGK